ncbi:MAG: mechanosensitive ion channel family protein [Flavobacteriales bacterium]|nr:mechanosensitive ion channel family protein [Flavobacteriales bacterium]
MNERLQQILDKLGFNLLLLAKVVLIIAAALVLERVIRVLLKRGYLRSDQSNEDRTRYRFMRNAVRFLVGLLALGAIIYSIPAFRHVAVTMFAGAGILVALLGFAAQGAFANIISGVFIVSFKPFRVGDQLTVGGHSGVVEDINLRHTVIVTVENRRVIIPNSKISEETIVNSTLTESAICELVEFSVSYDTDLSKAILLIQEESVAHPSCMDRRTPDDMERGEPAVPVRLIALGESAMTLRAYVWAKDAMSARMMHYDLNRAVKERFDREGVEIPYPHRTIIHRYEGAPPPAIAE